jgi:protein-tyrosine-phosphatase
MAEVLLRERCRLQPSLITVHSAGFLREGEPAAPVALTVMAARGLGLAQHRSALVSETVLRSAALVITMTGEHQRQAVDCDQRSWPKIFTLSELCTRIAMVDPRSEHETVKQYVARLHNGRSASQIINSGENGDVADPYGGPRIGYEHTADILDRYIAQLASALLRTSLPPMFSPNSPAAEVAVGSSRRFGRLFRRS